MLAEPAVHAWVASHGALLAAACLFYLWVHLPMALGRLVWAWLERPAAFGVARDTFVLAQVAGGTVAALARPVAVRALAVLYPVFVIAVTVATANHFLADALAAGGVAGVSAAVVAGTRRRLARRPVRAAGQSRPASTILSASAVGLVKMTSWLPGIWTRRYRPRRLDIRGCQPHSPGGSEMSSRQFR